MAKSKRYWEEREMELREEYISYMMATNGQNKEYADKKLKEALKKLREEEKADRTK